MLRDPEPRLHVLPPVRRDGERSLFDGFDLEFVAGDGASCRALLRRRGASADEAPAEIRFRFFQVQD